MNPKLRKILENQRYHLPSVVSELINGRKETHWCWYFLPNVHGLGTSPQSQEFAVTPKEFVEFMNNPEYYGTIALIVLLVDRALKNHMVNKTGKDILYVFGDNPIDVLKWNSFQTLLLLCSYHGRISLPKDVLSVVRCCTRCQHTVQLITQEFLN